MPLQPPPPLEAEVVQVIVEVSTATDPSGTRTAARAAAWMSRAAFDEVAVLADAEHSDALDMYAPCCGLNSGTPLWR